MTKQSRLSALLARNLAAAEKAAPIIERAIRELSALEDGDEYISHAGSLGDMIAHIRVAMPYAPAKIEADIIERFRESNDAWEEACARADWEREINA